MKIKSLVSISFLFLILFIACNDEKIAIQEDEQKISGEGIDLSVFSNFDSKVLARLTAYKRAALPVGIESIELDPLNQEINRFGEDRTIIIDGTISHDIDIYFVNYLTGQQITSVSLSIPSGGGTVSVPVSFAPFYDSDPYALRIIEMQYQVKGLADIESLGIFHQYPVQTLFSTDLRSKDFIIPVEGGTITVNKIGDYPTRDGQIVNFRVRLTDDSGDLSTGQIYMANADQILMTIPENQTGENRSFEIQYRALPDIPDWVTFDHGVQLAVVQHSMSIIGSQILNLTPSAGNAVVLLTFKESDMVNIDDADESTWPDIKVWAESDEYHKYIRTQIPPIHTTAKVNVRFEEHPGLAYYKYGTHYNAYAVVPYTTAGPQDGWYMEFESNLFSHPLVGGVGYWHFHYNNLREDLPIDSFLQTNWYMKAKTEDQGTFPSTGAVWEILLAGKWKEENLKFRVVEISNPTIASTWKTADDMAYSDYYTGKVFIELPVNSTGIEREYVLEICLSGDETQYFTWDATLPMFVAWDGTFKVKQQ